MSFLEPVDGRRHPAVPGSDLRRKAEEEHAEEIRSAGLAQHVSWSSVYVETHPDSEQIVVYTRGGAQWVDAYSEYALLPEARHGSDEVWHRRLTGAELRAQVPAHVGVMLDRGLPHERVVFPPKAMPIEAAPIAGTGEAE